jgi:hypothetical protein
MVRAEFGRKVSGVESRYQRMKLSPFFLASSALAYAPTNVLNYFSPILAPTCLLADSVTSRVNRRAHSTTSKITQSKGILPYYIWCLRLWASKTNRQSLPPVTLGSAQAWSPSFVPFHSMQRSNKCTCPKTLCASTRSLHNPFSEVRVPRLS